MWNNSRMFRYAADAGGGDGEEVEIESGDVQEDEEFEYVTEGSEEASRTLNDATEPEELRGKSRDEIMQELLSTRQKLNDTSAASQPTVALQQTMAQMLGQLKPEKAPVTPGYAAVPANAPQISDAEFEKQVNEMMLENPYKAQQMVQARAMEPLLRTFAVNQAQMSREMLLANPDNRKLYDKYSEEIERHVATVPMLERLQNPRVYQSALDTVKAKHMDELMSESMEAKLNEMLEAKLKELGVDPAKVKNAPQTKSTFVPSQSATRPPVSGNANKKFVVVPKWVEEEATRKGLDKGFYYEHLKSKGLVK